MGILSSVWNIYQGVKQNSEANQIHPEYSAYTASPYAAATLGNAQQLYGGRMAGAAAEERNIYGNAANTDTQVQKTATDASQALAVEAGTQAQAGKQFQGLQIQEDQNKYQLLNNLNLANQGETTEGDKVYQAQLQKYLLDVQQQSALRSSGAKNIGTGLSGIESTGTEAVSSLGGSSGSGSGSGSGSSLGIMSLIASLI